MKMMAGKMLRTFLYSALIGLIMVSCSSGKKAYERGDYYNATLQAVNRLDPREPDGFGIFTDDDVELFNRYMERMSDRLPDPRPPKRKQRRRKGRRR